MHQPPIRSEYKCDRTICRLAINLDSFPAQVAIQPTVGGDSIRMILTIPDPE